MDFLKIYELMGLEDSTAVFEEITSLGILAGSSVVYSLNDFVPRETVGDVDIFVLNSSVDNVHRLIEIIELYLHTSPVPGEYSISASKGNSIVNLEKGEVKIQLILTEQEDARSVLSSFDMDYVRCGYYQGEEIILDEAAIAHESGEIRVMKLPLRESRWEKAREKGFTFPYFGNYIPSMFTRPDVSIEYLPIEGDYRSVDFRPLDEYMSNGDDYTEISSNYSFVDSFATGSVKSKWGQYTFWYKIMKCTVKNYQSQEELSFEREFETIPITGMVCSEVYNNDDGKAHSVYMKLADNIKSIFQFNQEYPVEFINTMYTEAGESKFKFDKIDGMEHLVLNENVTLFVEPLVYHSTIKTSGETMKVNLKLKAVVPGCDEDTAAFIKKLGCKHRELKPRKVRETRVGKLIEKYEDIMECSEDGTREYHVAWSKMRALEYVERGDLKNALGSMASDMTRHRECSFDPMMYMGLMMGGHLKTEKSIINFITGFNYNINVRKVGAYTSE